MLPNYLHPLPRIFPAPVESSRSDATGKADPPAFPHRSTFAPDPGFTMGSTQAPNFPSSLRAALERRLVKLL
jgi:hypothetical protein